MEAIKTPAKTPEGLFRFGYVANLRNGVYIKELLEKLSDTDQEPTSQELKERANSAEVVLLNRHGYPKDAAGRKIPESKVCFKGFNTGYKLDGKFIFGWFERKNNESYFEGVFWATEQELKAYARLKEKTSHLFKMGDFFFDSIDDCQAFLDDIAKAAIPESWRYKNKPSAFNHPILKSYLETIFVKLTKERKVIKSADGKHIIFNTNLLDKFFHAIYIIAEVQEAEGLEVYLCPRRTAEESYRDFKKYGFPEDIKPLPPKFFEEVNEVIFNPSWKIDKNYDSLTHIIEERIDRFPAHIRTKDSYALARKLYDAIEYAIAIAQRNYKYIVPIYYPKVNRISFLMPIFLEGTYYASPDFALVLQADTENKMYIVRTIFDLETGYQDARLVAKPDESWLNPVTLK
ncbi:DUF3825 domain-containing protein [Alistipes putredinis]|uniref:DUF3825 domain-containing protein n=1 Tax=Alistipes putredinis TaxID=28117 RepID=UPI003A8F6FE2